MNHIMFLFELGRGILCLGFCIVLHLLMVFFRHLSRYSQSIEGGVQMQFSYFIPLSRIVSKIMMWFMNTRGMLHQKIKFDNIFRERDIKIVSLVYKLR